MRDVGEGRSVRRGGGGEIEDEVALKEERKEMCANFNGQRRRKIDGESEGGEEADEVLRWVQRR